MVTTRLVDLVKIVSAIYREGIPRCEGFEATPGVEATFYCRRVQDLKQQSGYGKKNPAVNLLHEGGTHNTFSTKPEVSAYSQLNADNSLLKIVDSIFY